MLTDRYSKLRRLIDACDRVEDLGELRDLMRGDFRTLFPHEVTCFGSAQIAPHRIVRLVNVDFPKQFLQRVIRPDQTITSPIFSSWLKTQRPIFISASSLDEHNREVCYRSDYKKSDVPQSVIVFENFMTYGVVDVSASCFSYFVFGNVTKEACNPHSDLLLETIPHMHVAMVRSLTRMHFEQVSPPSTSIDIVMREDTRRYEPESPNLTDREKQVLRHISTGKTNREIGMSLSISELTVKTHVKNLLVKLSVSRRTEAIRKAMEGNLLYEVIPS